MFELKVTLDNLLTFAGLLFVAWQMRDANKQSKLESQIRLQDVNRELVSLGFSRPELFEVLKDGKNVDPNAELYYLQLWLNQFCMFDALSRSAKNTSRFMDSHPHGIRAPHPHGVYCVDA